MACFARIDNMLVIEMHVLADEQPDGPEFLAGLWGGSAADYVPTPDSSEPGYPGVGWTYEGGTFTPPAVTEPDPTPSTD
jgi:hypothetical protein